MVISRRPPGIVRPNGSPGQPRHECPFPSCDTHYTSQHDLPRHFRTHPCPIRCDTISITRGRDLAAVDVGARVASGFPGIKDTDIVTTGAKGVRKPASPDNPNIVGTSTGVGFSHQSPLPPGDQREPHHPLGAPVCRCSGSNGGVRCGGALRGTLHPPSRSLDFSLSAPAPPYHHCGCGCAWVKTIMRYLDSIARPWKVRYRDALRLKLRKKLLRTSITPRLRSLALDLRGTDAARFGQSIHECLTTLPEDDAARAPILRLLQDVCSVSKELPSSYWLQQVDIDRRNPIDSGGEAQIYPATHRGKHVVARHVRKPDSGWKSEAGEETLQYMRQEIVTHAQLRNQNVIPFLGVFQVDGPAPVIILPYLENRLAVEYLKKISRTESAEELQIRTQSILLNVASALAYMHGKQPPIFHGDIHPRNILIDADGNAVLCDFGFSLICYENENPPTRGGGHPRYRAPEALLPTQASDIYSLGMTFLSLVTLLQPSEDRDQLEAARQAGLQRIRLQQPNNMNLMPTQKNPLWDLLESMWRHEPEGRPNAVNVKARLNVILSP